MADPPRIKISSSDSNHFDLSKGVSAGMSLALKRPLAAMTKDPAFHGHESSDVGGIGWIA